MKRAITLACVSLGLIAIAAPAASAGKGDKGPRGERTAKECAQLRKADRAAFRAMFGPKNAMRRCIRGAGADDVTPKDIRNAARKCRAERAEDPDAFREKYGSNRNKRNAFGKCVSKTVREAGESGGEEGEGEGDA